MNSLNATKVVDNVDKVEQSLKSEFDLSLVEALDIALRVYDAFSRVTSLHPKGAGGAQGWHEGTHQLRVTMIPKGWQPEDPNGQPRVVSSDKKKAIVLSSGNEFTGVAHQNPQTRNDKGSQTFESVHYNAVQGRFDFALPVVELLPSKGQALWMFLYYIDLDNREIRYELSRPTHMSDANRVDGWSVRYIFPSFSLPAKVTNDAADDDMPHAEVVVSPKVR